MESRGAIALCSSHCAGGAGKLLVAVRASCHILVVDCETLQESSFSLNGNDWDTHVSFNALYLTCSPDQKSFSVSTDNSLHLIFRLENAKRLRTLSSHTCGDYGKPKVNGRMATLASVYFIMLDVTAGFMGLHRAIFSFE